MAAAISIPSNGGAQATTQDIQNSLQSLQDGLNANPAVLTNPNQVRGAAPGTPVVQAVNGGINFSVVGANGRPSVAFRLNPNAALYTSPTSTAAAAAVSDLPKAGNYGWHFNTLTSEWSFALNSGGSIVLQTISTFGGSITATQHGDLHAAAGTFHAFSQLTGAITFAQHGNLAGGGTAHAFTDISGAITDTQHGALTGVNDHAAATTSGAGFMTTSQVTTLASLNSTVADITSGGAASHGLNCTSLEVNGTQVVGARNTGWSLSISNFTSTKSGTFDTTTITTQQLANLYFTLTIALGTHGLIGP